ncbi:MAG: hypothetical protein HKN33_14605 [Pyrinomonadaceae bacterium]|nr:hypothetical protein [Pyrinomonadaceae bacterium]
MELSLKPLGAGDLIDRATRFYRKNFWTFILIASPPVMLGTLCLVGWMFIARNLFYVGSANPEETFVYQVFVWLGGFVIWLVQLVAVLVVMGGAARNFVRHLLFGEAVTFKETYKNVRNRLPSLISVSAGLTVTMAVIGFVLFYIWLVVLFIVVAIIAGLTSFLPVVGFILSLVAGIAITLGALWLFFLIVSRFVYVPQVMLVEGQGAFAAIGRSASLAGKNVIRVGALSIFTIVATYVALMLLYLPLGFYAWTEGVNLIGFDSVDMIPAWYEISYKVIGQASLILIIPVLMIGLCLLYVDERVRSEGYDLELMAAKRLGEIPDVPEEFINPLQPALASSSNPAPQRSGELKNPSTLGLDQ